MTKIKGKLKIVNSNCESPQIPCYNHVLIDNEIFCIKNQNKLKDLFHYIENKETYHVYNVEIEGNISHEKGYMPNPMYEVPVIEIDSFKILE